MGGTKKLRELNGASYRRCRGRRPGASQYQKGEVGSRDVWRPACVGQDSSLLLRKLRRKLAIFDQLSLRNVQKRLLPP
jgi:hypothetical protein